MSVLSKLAGPMAAAAFMAVTAQPAKADCFYMEGGPETGFPKTPLPAFLSMASGDDEILGSTIPVSGRALSEKESEDLGNLMNFACLYRPDINRIYPDQEFAPSNIRDVSLVRALVKSREDKEYPVKMDFRSKSGVLISADVKCEDILLKFDPKTFLLPGPEMSEDKNSKRFMGSVITLISEAYRRRQAGQEYIGTYEQLENGTAPIFRKASKKGQQCAFLMS